MVYFALALWLFRGRNCDYGQVLIKLVDGLYHRRRGRDLLAGQLDQDGWVDGYRGRAPVAVAEHLLAVAGADEVKGLSLVAGGLGQHRRGGAGAGEADLVAGQGG